MRNNLSSKFALLAAASLMASPVAAAGTSSAPTLTGSYSPIVALSVLGSGVSAAALCGAVAASAAAQSPAGGCVLPAVDAPPVAVVEPVPPPPPFAPAPIAVASSGGGFLLPLIGGLAALVGILALIGFGDDNPDGDDLGPNPPPPITPQ